MIKKSNLYIVIILFFLGCEHEEMPINIEGLGEKRYRNLFKEYKALDKIILDNAKK